MPTACPSMCRVALLALKRPVEPRVPTKRLNSARTRCPTVFQVHNLTVRAKGKLLLENTSVTVAAGRRYGLVGPNGRGKSTLLRLMARRQIPVPLNIDVLLVEQEIVGDERWVRECGFWVWYGGQGHRQRPSGGALCGAVRPRALRLTGVDCGALVQLSMTESSTAPAAGIGPTSTPECCAPGSCVDIPCWAVRGAAAAVAAAYPVSLVPFTPRRTALQAVVEADVELMALRQEEKELMEALQDDAKEHQADFDHDAAQVG